MLKKSYKIDYKIYSDKSIEDAIIDYKDIANIKYEKWELIIEAESDLDEIFNELMNYVIYIDNN